GPYNKPTNNSRRPPRGAYQITIMTATLVMVDALIMTLYAFIAARLRPYLSPERLKQQNSLFAGFLVLIAVSLCFVKHTP
ncbi:MAG: hypothetical protein ACMX3H_15490, partial [Sodalis sp. (in: enterobacteria)]|uniref:hypothetical protein n=1 Tax=Sodalis sp. (in: enterobacteria) TaxID=1898979 RepID=UPI0039E72431